MLLFPVLSAVLLESSAMSQKCDPDQPPTLSTSAYRSKSGNVIIETEMHHPNSSKNNVIFLQYDVFSDDDGKIFLKTSSSAEKTRAAIPDDSKPEEPEQQTEEESEGKSEELEQETKEEIERKRKKREQVTKEESEEKRKEPEEGLEKQASFCFVAEPTGVEQLLGYQNLGRCRYYNILGDLMDWAGGVEACRKNGAHMLLLESQTEIEALSEWVGKHVWIGVHRKSSSEPWMNVLGKEMNPTDFFGLLPGTTSSGERHCIALHLSKSLKAMSNEPCDSLFRVVCEK